MTKELRGRLISRNKESNKDKPTNIEHSTTSEINNFDNAIKFLERIREKRKKKKQKKSTVKCHTKKFPSSEILQDNSTKVGEEPPCGILKNGKKPLWRDYHKTRKKKLTVENESISLDACPGPVVVIEPVVVPEPVVVVDPVVVVPDKVVVVDPVVPDKVVVVDPVVVPEKIVAPDPIVAPEKTKIVLGKSKSKLRFLLKTRKKRKKSKKYTQKNLLKNTGILSNNANIPEDVIEVMYNSIVDDNGDTLCKVNKE